MVNNHLFGVFLRLKVILNMTKLILNAVTDCRAGLSGKMGFNVIVTRVCIIYSWATYFTIIALTLKASAQPTQR